jgi:hypothetical protein
MSIAASVGHDGPRWLHENLEAMQRNLALLEQATSSLSLLAFGQEEEARLADLEAGMRSAGMAPGETIAEYLARAGWPPAVAEAYQRCRAEINAATEIALQRIEAEAQTQARRQKQYVMLWLAAVLEAHIAIQG